MPLWKDKASKKTPKADGVLRILKLAHAHEKVTGKHPATHVIVKSLESLSSDSRMLWRSGMTTLLP